ncbi:MAG: hypothetical protein LBH84_00060 [Prevotellaceae bacterium]|jgi:hypothetical protein|nr:hypothetical protein [Prevotellaceae bacterium]
MQHFYPQISSVEFSTPTGSLHAVNNNTLIINHVQCAARAYALNINETLTFYVDNFRIEKGFTMKSPQIQVTQVSPRLFLPTRHCSATPLAAPWQHTKLFPRPLIHTYFSQQKPYVQGVKLYLTIPIAGD